MFAATRIFRQVFRSSAPACLGVLFAGCALPAWGAERVTLRSGFSVVCTAHEAVGAGTMRLYLSAPALGNYMDVALASVAAIEPETTPIQAPPSVAAAPGTDLSGLLEAAGSAHNVNVLLLASVIHAESAGHAHAASRAGAQGLMQLMPATAAALGVHNSFLPNENVNGGSAYLDQLLTRYHDNLPLAVAAYNAGPAAVDRYHGVPPFRETRLYVAKVLREFNRQVQRAGSRAAAAAASVVPQDTGR